MNNRSAEPPAENPSGESDRLGQKLDRIAAALEKLNSLSEQKGDGKEDKKGEGNKEGGDKDKKDDGDQGKKPGKFKRFVTSPLGIIVIVVALAVLVIAGLALLHYEKTHESTDDAYTTGHTHMVSPRVQGLVLERWVDDTRAVAQADVDTTKSTLDANKAAFNAAKANVEAAESNLKAAEATRESRAGDLEAAKAAVDVARSNVDNAKLQLSYCWVLAPVDGRVGKGERVWILAKLPDSIRVVGDDITDKFLLLTNSHDGTSSLQVKFTPVRVVCQNTLTLAINNGQSGIKISHHTDIHQRLKAAEKMLGIVRHQFDELADTFREMVQVPMNHNRLEKYLEYVYPEPKDRLPTESEAECIARDRSWSEYFFDQGAGNRLRGVEGTLWAAYNGVTEWLDHRKIRQSADQRLASIWFGEANRIKARALTVAVEMLPHFRN